MYQRKAFFKKITNKKNLPFFLNNEHKVGRKFPLFCDNALNDVFSTKFLNNSNV